MMNKRRHATFWAILGFMFGSAMTRCLVLEPQYLGVGLILGIGAFASLVMVEVCSGSDKP